MPAKYSHVKKRPPLKKLTAAQQQQNQLQQQQLAALSLFPLLAHAKGGTTGSARRANANAAAASAAAATSTTTGKSSYANATNTTNASNVKNAKQPTMMTTKKLTKSAKSSMATKNATSSSSSSLSSSPLATLEYTISRILLLRFEADIARLFSAHLHRVALRWMPVLAERLARAAGSPSSPLSSSFPASSSSSSATATAFIATTTTTTTTTAHIKAGTDRKGNTNKVSISLQPDAFWNGATWGLHEENYASEEIKTFMRAVVAREMREAGERVATRSVLWSYTALRDFAIANDIPICAKKGLHSLRLLPFLPALQAHLAFLERSQTHQITFAKPTHLAGLPPMPVLVAEPTVDVGIGSGGSKLSGSGGTEDEDEDGEEDGDDDDDEGEFNEDDDDEDEDEEDSEEEEESDSESEEQDFLSAFLKSSISASSSSTTATAPPSAAATSSALAAANTAASALHQSTLNLTQTLWSVAREFDVRGYGGVLRDKLINKWCECGCSTDHLGEVCEKSVREEMGGGGGGMCGESCTASVGGGGGGGGGREKEKGKENVIGGGKEKGKGKAHTHTHTHTSVNMTAAAKEKEKSGVRAGKRREWDGRGSGVYGWETEDEEDVWEGDLDFGSGTPRRQHGDDAEEGEEEDEEEERTVGESMEIRYLKAEKEKEEGNVAFRKGEYECAVEHYVRAHSIEPEMPAYQLNLGAAYLKLNKWMEAEEACTKALSQHQSSKGYFRRAKARKMLGRTDEAIKDLRRVLKHHPSNEEAIVELAAILGVSLNPDAGGSGGDGSGGNDVAAGQSSTAAAMTRRDLLDRLGVPKPKRLKHPPVPQPGLPNAEGTGEQPPPIPLKKTVYDERKLKIVVLPAADPHKDYHTQIHIKSGMKGEKEKKKMTTMTPAEAAVHVLEGLCEKFYEDHRGGGEESGVKKDRSKMTVKEKEMDELRGSMKSYPSWGGYMVKRVE